MPWVLGGLGAVVLLVGVGVIVLVAAASDDDPPKPAPTAAATTAVPPAVETAAPADAASSAQPKAASTVTPPSTRFTATPSPPPIPPPRPTVTVPTATTSTSTALAPFNRAKAQAAVDRAGANLGSCVQSSGPFGGGSIRIDFEPDGRVGTLTRPPFAGTPEGSCISARFLSIRIGPFLGTTQSIERAFIMQQ